MRDSAAPLSTDSNEQWDETVDIVVIGFGGAGATAAITAADLGASVIIIEKAREGEHGGNTRVSGQGYLNPSSASGAADYVRALNGPYAVTDAIVDAFAGEVVLNNDWLRSVGGEPEEHMHQPASIEFPELLGSNSVHRFHHGKLRGYSNTWRVLEDAVWARSIAVKFDTPAHRLIQDAATKEIIGVAAGRGESQTRIRARKAVILASGGFEANLQMIRDYLPGIPFAYPLGTPHNEGDGIYMALEVGADLWHMNSYAGPSFAFKAPEYASVFPIWPLQGPEVRDGGMIIVGPDGARFVDEKMRTRHGKVLRNGRWQPMASTYPMHLIFDQTLYKSGPLYDATPYNGWTRVVDRYEWSADNSAELARGWIRSSATLSGLAQTLGLPADTLERSVSTWNAGCAVGKDEQFGRDQMLNPILTPPFYAIELSPTMFNTQGGPRKNERGQVLSVRGAPIPRLYCCGELGSIFGNLYQGAGNIAEGFAFGRICARNAVAEIAQDN